MVVIENKKKVHRREVHTPFLLDSLELLDSKLQQLPSLTSTSKE